MKLFFLIVDLLLPIAFILQFIFSKYYIKKGINDFLGFRTVKSKLNFENWCKANSLFGKYFLILGIFSLIFSMVFRNMHLFSIEVNSLILAFINIILMILTCIFINQKI